MSGTGTDPHTGGHVQLQVGAIGPDPGGGTADPYQHRPTLPGTGGQPSGVGGTHPMAGRDQYQVEGTDQCADHVAPGRRLRRNDHGQAFEGHADLGRSDQTQVGITHHRCPRSAGGGLCDQGQHQGAGSGAGHPDAASPPQAVGEQVGQRREDRQRALDGQDGRPDTTGRLGPCGNGPGGGSGLTPGGQVVERFRFGQEGNRQGHTPVSNICSILARARCRQGVLRPPRVRAACGRADGSRRASLCPTPRRR